MTNQPALPINDRIMRFLGDATEIMKNGLHQSPIEVQQKLLDTLKNGGHLATRIEHVAVVAVAVVLELHYGDEKIEVGRFLVEGMSDPAAWIN